MKRQLQMKKPSSVGKRYPGQQQNFARSIAGHNHSKLHSSSKGYEISTDAAERGVIVSDECACPGGCEPFEEFIPSNYDRVDEKDFYDQKVTVLRKKDVATNVR